MSFCEFQAVKWSQSREIHRCTRKRQGCTRNRRTSGRGSPPDRSIRLCACGTLRTADWYNECLNLCGGERDNILCAWCDLLSAFNAILRPRAHEVCSVPWLPLAEEIVADQIRLWPSIQAHGLLPLGQPVLPQAPDKHYNVPWPQTRRPSQSHGNGHRSIYRAENALFMRR